MSLNISLYTVSAALILGPEGQRLYAKYYQISDAAQAYKTPQQQATFEKAIYSKINKQHQDLILYDNHLVTYKQTNDVILVIVSALNENESMLYSLTNNINEALTILLGNSLDKSVVLLKYDMVCLCMDETIEDGIIIEIDPAIIVSRVTNPPSGSAVASDMNMNIDLSEKGLFGALSFASKKISERLQQGL
ncbi:snare-like protein [Metschnikowia bicuspidata var. bicuspidata NRRL YB-4993]|uniref:Coatomer subunit zeta n=1 Tax=Metschnikowia bicuspidata var. bicuspidata NRRL YB-4993 TaxID=869754 RepID=A0A1A0HCH4_9ASCO|nr:snare-like protein [Metschnikowia bicuspidata var. bicuspidata NRRL YB-4993]OBA21814.1 snare-like protein [Metschnikowia bicuspidata var. bicuspidata NRRL YB-4993]